MRLVALNRMLENEREAARRAREEWAHERAKLLGEPAQAPRTRLLFVHHDANVRAIARSALASSSYELTLAPEGLEAIRLASTLRPDVIVAASQMPKMDGRELARLLHSRPETAAIRIVLMDSNVSPTDPESLRRGLEKALAPRPATT